MTTTHLLRGNASRVERWSKFPWVRLDAVVLNRVRVHEHDFVGYACDKRECGGEKYNQFRVHEFQNASCCDAVSRVPPARDLRLNHYQYKSPECSREKAGAPRRGFVRRRAGDASTPRSGRVDAAERSRRRRGEGTVI